MELRFHSLICSIKVYCAQILLRTPVSDPASSPIQHAELPLQYPGLYFNTSHDRELSTSGEVCLVLSLAGSQCFFSLNGVQQPLALVPSPVPTWSPATWKLFSYPEAELSAPWPALLQDIVPSCFNSSSCDMISILFPTKSLRMLHRP